MFWSSRIVIRVLPSGSGWGNDGWWTGEKRCRPPTLEHAVPARHAAGLKQTADSDDGDVGVPNPMTRRASLHFEEGLCGMT
jgi:hypothetical protein